MAAAVRQWMVRSPSQFEASRDWRMSLFALRTRRRLRIGGRRRVRRRSTRSLWRSDCRSDGRSACRMRRRPTPAAAFLRSFCRCGVWGVYVHLFGQGDLFKRLNVGEVFHGHAGQGVLHEFDPDRQCGASACLAAAERLLLIVKSHPDARGELRRESHVLRASVKSFVVPVFPAEGRPSALAPTAVPKLTTSASIATMLRATSGERTSCTVGRASSSRAPS